MPIGRAKSMGIREAFYMTFSYKEIRLCLAIGKPVSIVTGYGVQASARRSSQDGRRPAFSGQVWRSASSGQVWRPAVRYGVNRSGMAVCVQRPAVRYGDKAPFVPHFVLRPARFLPTDRRFPKCPLTSEKLSTGANRGLSHLAVDKAISSV